MSQAFLHIHPWPHTVSTCWARDTPYGGFTSKQLAGGKVISPTCAHLLNVRKDQDQNRKLILRFQKMAKRFFTGV